MAAGRLTSVDGQRVMAILDDCVQKLGFVSLLKKEALGSDETIISALGEDSAPFIALKEATDKLNTALDRDDYEMIEAASCDVETITISICRLLKDNSKLLDNIRNLQVKAGNPKNSPAFRALLSVINDLRELTHLRIASTVEDERARNFFFADMVSKEKKMSGDLKALVAQLADARIQRERDSMARKAHLSKLRDEIQEMKETTVNEIKALEKETSSREAFDLANFTESENAKNEELQSMQKSLDEKSSTNKKKELMLRKKKSRVEKELENWILKYDQDMEEKETELALLQQDYERESKELNETEEAYHHYDKLMKEREVFVAEHKRKEAIDKREKGKKRRLNEAASVIQRAWKNYKIKQKAAVPTTKQRKKSPKKGRSPSPNKAKKSTSRSASPKKNGSTAKPTSSGTIPKAATQKSAGPKPKTPNTPTKK